MSRSRVVGLCILLVSLGLGVFAVLEMSRRVAAYNEQAHFGHFRFDVGNSREFKANGKPVSIQDSDDQRGDGRASLVISYDGKATTVPVVEPPAVGVPDLGIYGDWAKVIEVHQVVRSADGSLADKPDSGRLLLICRVPPAGYDPETWGSVRRSDWTFDFHEFMPDGTIASTTYRWPRSELGDLTLKKEVEKGDEAAKVLAGIPELEEQTWQYQAALHVIPKLNVPQYRFKNTAMKAMGWTLPVAGFCGLGLVVGAGLLLAPRRTQAAESPPTKPRGL
jgi:hypothetical protein